MMGWAIVDPYLFPARGRKRICRLGPPEFSHEVDPYLFPARGRKLGGHSLCPHRNHRPVDPYLFPARGRKLLRALTHVYLPLIPTFSPQGDGNLPG